MPKIEPHSYHHVHLLLLYIHSDIYTYCVRMFIPLRQINVCSHFDREVVFQEYPGTHFNAFFSHIKKHFCRGKVDRRMSTKNKAHF